MVKQQEWWMSTLLNSGYSREQTRSILVSGIKAYEGRKIKCMRLGRKVKRRAKDSLEDRTKKILLSKSNWYKGGARRIATEGGRLVSRREGSSR